MKFTIAHSGFLVRITDEVLRDDQGKEAAELFDWPHQTIWISSRMPVQRRLHSLFHSIRHGWQMTLGTAADAESDADQAASYAISTWKDLERQGGEAALMRMMPDGVVDQGADIDLAIEPRAAQCPQCNGLLSMPIRTSTPKLDPRYSRLIVWRSGDCDFCSHIVAWREGATTKGVPTGTVIGEPEIRAGGHAVPSA